MTIDDIIAFINDPLSPFLVSMLITLAPILLAVSIVRYDNRKQPMSTIMADLNRSETHNTQAAHR